MSNRKVAVVVFNLGGPAGPADVRPFLFNLFNDRAILNLPQPGRAALAWLISTTRAEKARANYAFMGGGSPIVPETQAQAQALDAEMTGRNLGFEAKSFLAMRYWHPFASETAVAAKAWGATEAVLLPLYPQFSSSTTASSMEAWAKAWKGPSRTICCYPAGEKLAAAHADEILAAWRAGGEPENPRVLFSAHGLPQRTIDRGDSYQWQVEQTAAAVKARLPQSWDFVISYQSRVGPLKWIGPDTESEVERAGAEKQGVIVCPIAFVSEHIETLVELDIEYKELAHEAGCPYYLRARAPGVNKAFIAGLADQVVAALADTRPVRSECGARICPGQFGLCPQAQASL